MAHSHLVVEGLDYAVDEFMLQQYFKQYGTIQYVDVKYDEERQQPLGHAHVKFVNPSAYIKVFNDSPHKINKKECKIRLQRDAEL